MEDNNTTSAPSLFQHAAKWGLIMGAIGIAITAVLYAVDYTMLADWKTGILILLIAIGFTIYAGINYRSQLDGFIPYGKAFQHGFVLLAVSGILSTVFMVLLYTVIDTELPAKLTEASMDKTREMMEGFGMDEDALDKAMEDARKRSEGQFSAKGALMGYAFALIFYAIMSLITSLFVKKSPPEMV